MAKNDFEAFVENASANEAHSLEIQQTRIGGLGGSDAAMVYKIGCGGLAALNNSDLTRLAVMRGLQEQQSWGGNNYTKAGHKFEDWYDGYLQSKLPELVKAGLLDETTFAGSEKKYEREYVLSAPLAKEFKTFAHADFALGNWMAPRVIECKFVTTKTTDKVLDAYYAQLQWYYMLGAECVWLLHGTGTVDDVEAGTEFEVEDGDFVKVERDENYIKILLAGIKTLDKALADGWLPVAKNKAELGATTDTVREAFAVLAAAKEKMEAVKNEEAAAKQVLMEYMDAFCFNGIVDPECGRQVLWVGAKTTPRFDLKAFKKMVAEKVEHEQDGRLTLEQIMQTVDEAHKTSTTAPTIMFK